MLRFTKDKTVSAIARITGYVGNLAQSTTITTVTSCYLRPLSETESSDNGYLYGVAYMAIFEVTDDVRQQDKITINGTQYLVKGTALHDRGYRTQYLKAIITKPEA